MMICEVEFKVRGVSIKVVSLDRIFDPSPFSRQNQSSLAFVEGGHGKLVGSVKIANTFSLLFGGCKVSSDGRHWQIELNLPASCYCIGQGPKAKLESGK